MFEGRFEALLSNVRDDTVRQLLEGNAAGDPSARDGLRDHLMAAYRQVKAAQQPRRGRLLRTSLRVAAAVGSRAGAKDVAVHQGRLTVQAPIRKARPQAMRTLDQTLRADQQWAQLAALCMVSAEALWLGMFHQYENSREARQALGGGWWDVYGPAKRRKDPSADFSTLVQITSVARQLLRLWLESSLYRMRTFANLEAREAVQRDVKGGNPTRAGIRKLFQEYRQTGRKWDRELKSLAGARFFRSGPRPGEFEDSYQFKRLHKVFGLTLLSKQDEGWAAQVADSEAELHFQIQDELRRERWRTKHWPSALGFGLLKITTGYGTRPLFFVRTAIVVIATFMLLFFANDFFNPGIASGQHFCPEAHITVTHWYDVGGVFLRYLYLAVTNLSSLGSNADVARYCSGQMTQAMLVASALTGYFMLATLAALFFQVLTKGE